MHRTRTFLLLLALAPACTSPAPPAPAAGNGDVWIGGIHWFSSYEEALVVARETGKPLLLHFGENPG